MSDTPASETTPEEVIAFLKSKKDGKPLVADTAIELPGGGSDIAALGGVVQGDPKAEEQAAQKEKEDPGVPLPPHADPSQPTSSDFLSLMLSNPVLGDIEVTDEEKLLFVKNFFADEPLIFALKFCKDQITVKVRSLTEGEIHLMWYAIDYEMEKKIIAGPALTTMRMQQYSVAMQVEDIGNRKWERFKNDPSRPRQQQVEELSKFVQATIEDLDQLRYTIMLRAVQIFEVKTKLCLDAMRKGDF